VIDGLVACIASAPLYSTTHRNFPLTSGIASVSYRTSAGKVACPRDGPPVLSPDKVRALANLVLRTIAFCRTAELASIPALNAGATKPTQGETPCPKRRRSITSRLRSIIPTQHATTVKQPSTTKLAFTRRRPITAHTAAAHAIHARDHAEEARKAHTEEHGQK
jgi:hypothetical protein